MIKLVTYCSDNMTISANILKQSAYRNNVESVEIMTKSDIDDGFYTKHIDILSAVRGAGYWLWKPYIIDRVMSKSKDGDVIIYADAGVEIINNVYYIIDRMDKFIFLFGNQYQHVHWCKGEAIRRINPEGGVFDKQVQASVIFFKVGPESKKFVKEWLKHCTKPGMIDDSPSEYNHPEFKEHRHDQAILTCMAYRDGIQFHWWPAKYNAGVFSYPKDGYQSDRYPEIFHHHRFRNNDFSDYSGINFYINQYFKQKKYEQQTNL